MINSMPQKCEALSRRPHVAVMGTWNWLDVAAELLRRAGITCEVLNISSIRQIAKWMLKGHWRRFDAFHHVQGFDWYWGSALAAVGKPVIWHWIGTDVVQFRQMHQTHRGWRRALAFRVACQWACGHVADSDDLANELLTLGIRAETVRLLPETIEADVIPFPEKSTVLAYWHPQFRDAHRASDIMKLAEAFSDTKFLIAGDSGEGLSAPQNVEFLGWLPNLLDVYPRVSILVRLVQHDSLSAMVLEALARGRYVVYSKDFPQTETASNFEQAKNILQTLLNRREPNIAGSRYVSENFTLQEQADKLRLVYQRLLKKELS